MKTQEELNTAAKAIQVYAEDPAHDIMKIIEAAEEHMGIDRGSWDHEESEAILFKPMSLGFPASENFEKYFHALMVSVRQFAETCRYLHGGLEWEKEPELATDGDNIVLKFQFKDISVAA